MSSTKRRGGMSPTTVILVLVLLGAVAGASRIVTPPPPGPPAEVKQAPAGEGPKPSPNPAADKARMKMYEDKMRTTKYVDPKALAPVKDPSQIEVTNDYFRKTKPGEAGFKQVDEDMKAKTAAYAEYQRKQAALQAKNKAGAAAPESPNPK